MGRVVVVAASVACEEGMARELMERLGVDELVIVPDEEYEEAMEHIRKMWPDKVVTEYGKEEKTC